VSSLLHPRVGNRCGRGEWGRNQLTTREGKLHLEPTVVGLSKFNEAVQKLKNGQVAG